MAAHARVTVPASTANLGPGFDCLGLALGLFNTVEIWDAGDGEAFIEISGEGADQLPQTSDNLILRSAAAVFEKAGAPPRQLRVRATNGIPLGSGMGSSAAAVVGGLVAANALLDGKFDRAGLLRLAFEIEGHPDNAAPAIFGGLVIVSATGEELMTRSVQVPQMHAAIALPNLRLSTAEARAALPKTVPLPDAVFNIGRAALVVQALAAGDYDLLRWAMADRLHQPFRRKLIPGYDEAVSAAHKAGAAAVALSGAGPSLVAFAREGHERIAQAMAAAFQRAGLSARTFVLPVDRQGVRVTVAG
jgi:homoserine kinase